MRVNQRGMTLLEILVALTIFILLAGAGYSGLQQGLNIEESLQQQRIYWRRLDSVMTLFQQDFDQVRNLSQRMPLSATRAFVGSAGPDPSAQGEILLFTRGGHASFAAGVVSPYQKIAYRYRNGTLFRASWPRLNMPEASQAEEAEILGQVSAISLKFMNADHQWFEYWPITSGSVQAQGLPELIELTMTLENEQSYKRVFHVGISN